MISAYHIILFQSINKIWKGNVFRKLFLLLLLLFLKLGLRRAQRQVLEIGLASISPKGVGRDKRSQEKTNQLEGKTGQHLLMIGLCVGGG